MSFSLIHIIPRPLRSMFDRSDNSHAAWFETVVISTTAPAVGWLLSPNDPLLIHASFPWLLLPPLFVALRHGFAFGVTSCLSFIFLITLFWRYDLAGIEGFPSILAIGMMMITMLTGEFSDYWQRRLKKEDLENKQRSERMESFTLSYHLLRISYNHLVEQLAGSSVSLRQSVQALHVEMLDLDEHSDALNVKSDRILQLFCLYGSVQTASLHRVTSGNIETAPLARLGETLVAEDSLPESDIVNEALKKGEMVSVLTADNGSPLYVDGHILAVVPFSDQLLKCQAVMVVYRLPFLEFNDGNLRLIAVMADYISLLFRNLEQGSGKNASMNFLNQLQLSLHHFHAYDIQSRLLGVTIHGTLDMNNLLAQSRNQDEVWLRIKDDGSSVLLWLMPFSDDHSIENFQNRIILWQEHSDSEKEEKSHIEFQLFPMTSTDSAETMMEKVERSYGLHAE